MCLAGLRCHTACASVAGLVLGSGFGMTVKRTLPLYTVGPQQVPMIHGPAFPVYSTATFSDTSNIPQHDPDNYLGLHVMPYQIYFRPWPRLFELSN